ncbi:competence protein ComK [Lederbergia citrea]|uniref:competence protein ComK n=1 Tax=Lederbergia citrea TaxID=2833581 RepID=UPI001BCA187F|nr:competence protein ComK [Lederbergia citrea]MBS4204816.1 competence protein ComK [Lederbergia citrea]
MNVVDEYVINVNTSAILNEYDEAGALCALVLEGNKIVKVKMSPLSVIERSIEYYGNGLQGAIKGARNALGNISMPPVMICGKLGIYWFPSKSITHDDCVWFSIDHIEDYYSLSNKGLKVIFRDGTDITIDSNYSRFDNKVNRARKLQYIMENRTNGKQRNPYSQMKNFMIVRDPARKHYSVDSGE